MSERPELPDGYLGPQEKFQDLGLTTKTHHEPEFETRENEFILKMLASQPVKLTGKVINENTGKESLERVFVQTCGQIISLLVSLDTPGYHRLQLYALPASDESKQLPGVYNFLIYCTGMGRKSRLFPKQFARWREGCVLLEPFSVTGDTTPCGDMSFRVVVPAAHAVAVTVGEDWFHLEPEGNGTDTVIWTGQVQDIQKYLGDGKVAVLNANLDAEDESKYFSLLQWNL